MWDDLGRPIKSDEAGFLQGLDADKDGVGCEQDPNYTNKAEDGSAIKTSTSSGSSSSGRLAHTGFTASLIAGAGALTLLAGGAALVANRRRKA